jgi:hypothetical protein
MVENVPSHADHGAQLQEETREEPHPINNSKGVLHKREKTQGLRQVFSDAREQKRVLRQRLTCATLADHKSSGGVRNAEVARHTTAHGSRGWHTLGWLVVISRCSITASWLPWCDTGNTSKLRVFGIYFQRAALLILLQPLRRLTTRTLHKVHRYSCRRR